MSDNSLKLEIFTMYYLLIYVVDIASFKRDNPSLNYQILTHNALLIIMEREGSLYMTIKIINNSPAQ